MGHFETPNSDSLWAEALLAPTTPRIYFRKLNTARKAMISDMTIDRWVAVFTLTVATIALLLSYLTWRSAEKAIRPLNCTVDELRRLTADESLSRQAKALSEVVAGLALISMERSRIQGD